LAQGQEIEITELAPTSSGASWIAVVGPGGLRGYLPSEADLYRYYVLRLAEETSLRVEASEASSVLIRYGRGAALLLVGSEMRDGRRWLKLRDGDGREGFVPDETRFEDTSQAARVRAVNAVARRNMLVGALWCGGGHRGHVCGGLGRRHLRVCLGRHRLRRAAIRQRPGPIPAKLMLLTPGRSHYKAGHVVYLWPHHETGHLVHGVAASAPMAERTAACT
jgi:hypothetical protein